jgi:hypothetical protein
LSESGRRPRNVNDRLSRGDHRVKGSISVVPHCQQYAAPRECGAEQLGHVPVSAVSSARSSRSSRK